MQFTFKTHLLGGRGIGFDTVIEVVWFFWTGPTLNLEVGHRP